MTKTAGVFLKFDWTLACLSFVKTLVKLKGTNIERIENSHFGSNLSF